MKRRFFRLPWRTARQISADVDDELAFHVDMRVAELMALGVEREAARTRALREFGDMDDARSYMGAIDRHIEAAQRRSEYMKDLIQDVKYAARKLWSTPAFTVAALLTLALGIGATTAIFSVVDTVLLKPLPFPQPGRLVRIRFNVNGQGDAGTPMDLVDYRTQAKSFAGFSVIDGMTANVTTASGDVERVTGTRVNANLFDLLRVSPLRGRFFAPGDDKPGAARVVVLGEALWRRDFAGDSGIIGRSVRINSAPYTVIGIVATGKQYPIQAEVWVPEVFDARTLSDQTRGARWLGLLARVKDEVPIATANAEARNISVTMEKRFPVDFKGRRAAADPLQDFLVGDMQKPLYVILSAVVLVLIIACANVANLLLVRATAREGEMAIRTALGAGRGRLVRQLVTESVVLSVLGAVGGIAIAKVGMIEMLRRAPQSLVFVNEATINATTLLVTLGIAVATGLLFGALPALQVARSQVALVLRSGGRGLAGRQSANRTKRAIVIGELALAVTLLSGAGLLLRSFSRLVSVDPGFRADGVFSAKLSLPQASYDTVASRTFATELLGRVRALPGAETAALSSFVPLDGSSYGFTFAVRGDPAPTPGDEPSTQVRTVSSDFFKTLDIPVLKGRPIDATDVAAAPRVYVVNRAFADKFLHGRDPVGQAVHLDWGGDPDGVYNQIVGVVGNVHSAGLSDQPEPTVYASIVQYPMNSLTVLIHSGGSTAAFAGPVRSIVRDLDHDLSIYSVLTMDERVEASVGRQKFYATLVAIFASVALALAAIGLYGVIAYTVSQRTRELGVRVALGATKERIVRMVIMEGMSLTALGVSLGLVVSLAGAGIMSTLIFGIAPRDPITLAVVVVALSIVAIFASWLPARRAARVDPVVAMRGE